MQFNELNLNPNLLKAIDDLGFRRCTDVQAETLTCTLSGNDVAVQSQTGTGKTAAFLITIFQLMNESDEYRGTRALIVAPTRELAVQIENDAKALGKYLPQRTTCIYGGVGYGQQERSLAESVEIVIGTPGRLLDFSQSGKVDFREMGIIVIDEADRLFDMGFYPDIRKMMRRARPRTERLTMLYSATLSVKVRNIAWQFMNDPKEIEIEPEHLTVDTVQQELYHVAQDEKFPLLLGLLRRESPRNAIIFCNTKRATEIVAKKLELNGYHCDFIIGDLPQHRRLKIIERIKSGDTGLLTATDVAARGLHVDDLDLVVNYDLPEDPEAYVHRIGRTARAGKQGKAISLACERFVYSLEPIEELIGMKIPSASVSDEVLAVDESEGKRLAISHGLERPARARSSGRAARTGSRGGRDRGVPGRGTAGRSVPGHSGPSVGGVRHSRSPKHAAAEAGAEAGSRSRGPAPRTHRDPRPQHERPDGARDRGRPGPGEKAPSRSASMDDRIAYYRQKYGEDFVSKDVDTSRPTRPSPPPQSEPRAARTAEPVQAPREERVGLIGRIAGLLKGRREGRVDAPKR